MTHELKSIVSQALYNQNKGLKNVLASVVFLEGSSYRKPGVRMLISEDGLLTGALSGGCVEKEVLRRAHTVFKNRQAKVITYDGRYRLGCEGILYILLEPFFVSPEFSYEFHKTLEARESFSIDSYYLQNDEVYGSFGSVVRFQNNLSFSFFSEFNPKAFQDVMVFSQTFDPIFNLIIIGGEHDAVKLCSMASILGWQVDVVTTIKDPKKISDFPGASSVTSSTPELFKGNSIGTKTGIIIMNHSYVLDLQFLLKLQHTAQAYLGILGAPNRRNRMFNDLFEHYPAISEEFLDTIYMPAGLHIGAKTPEEIALSILAEILTVIREKTPFFLKDSIGSLNI